MLASLRHPWNSQWAGRHGHTGPVTDHVEEGAGTVSRACDSLTAFTSVLPLQQERSHFIGRLLAGAEAPAGGGLTSCYQAWSSGTAKSRGPGVLSTWSPEVTVHVVMLSVPLPTTVGAGASLRVLITCGAGAGLYSGGLLAEGAPGQGRQVAAPSTGLKVRGSQGSLLWDPGGQWESGGHLYPRVPSKGEGTALPPRQMYLRKWRTMAEPFQHDLRVLARQRKTELCSGQGQCSCAKAHPWDQRSSSVPQL